MKVVLYFGSFNPIHKGHIELAKYLLKNNICDKVWLVLSPQNPLKVNSVLWDDNSRLSLANKAVANIDDVVVSDVEFSLPKPNYTVDTLRTLRKKYNQIQFSLLIGADNYIIFDKWRNYQEILDNHTVYVYPRNSELICDKSKFPTIKWLEDAPLIDISSTKIRERLHNCLSVSDLLPEEIIHDVVAYYSNISK